MEKGSKDQEESTSRITGSKACPSELLKDSHARARADVRRPRVSASHFIQAGNDLFIGRSEAHIINRKKGRIGATCTCMICS